MLLRRITEHVKAQNWTAVALDFVIVVVGVFIGIQVSNWNDARGERRAYLNALDRLRGEIVANFEMLDLADADVASELPVVRTAYDALETCSDDPETRQKINAGLKLISGANSIRVRTGELSELTSSAQLLSQQSPEMRRRLSDLQFYVELALNAADSFEEYPQQSRPERITVLRPGPRVRQDSTYLGLEISDVRRLLQLDGPISEACRNHELVAALWAWDRYQGNLFFLTQKMRQEYKLTLDLLSQEISR